VVYNIGIILVFKEVQIKRCVDWTSGELMPVERHKVYKLKRSIRSCGLEIVKSKKKFFIN